LNKNNEYSLNIQFLLPSLAISISLEVFLKAIIGADTPQSCLPLARMPDIKLARYVSDFKQN
ncbi:MAG: hypothetical protein ACKOA8_00065, partial [Deltaproteobacteria bacterium]